MKKILKYALTAALLASLPQIANAAFTTNNLYLGFNQDSAQGDYIVDLGDATNTLGLGGTNVVDLSSHFSLSSFNSIFSGGANGVNVAVVAGDNVFGHYDIYATQVRVGGAGNPAVAGSDLTTLGHSQSQVSGAAAVLTGNPWPTAGNDTNDSTKSYTAKVGPTTTAGDFIGKCGVNPFGTFDSLAVVYLDLWYATPTAAYTYLGYFKFDLSTGTPHVNFTPAGAPNTSQPTAPVLTITRTGATNFISFSATSSATYNLIYTNLSGLTAPRSNWFTLGSSITGANGVTNFTDSAATPGRVYSVTAH